MFPVTPSVVDGSAPRPKAYVQLVVSFARSAISADADGRISRSEPRSPNQPLLDQFSSKRRRCPHHPRAYLPTLGTRRSS